ncbi:hypothetical protein H8S33_11055 [Ornithinibacillus sp. BX22]|uniref:Type VII secretion protein EssB n=1 Tax=Ornithinibacillus hominis TaxID=2763055 RepID=A0A923RJD7_9BACI|nr:type VII secretion protein EssB/YukC [Ornithinibacillus hominis]MBC5637343.1 hypothetical protein [Ornithinibacillus hominis]
MNGEISEDFGTIRDNGEIIVYEIPSKLTKLKEAEQLEELKRPDDMFFECQHFIVDGEWLRIYFKRNSHYHNISEYLQVSTEKKRVIVMNLIELSRLIGTQYTTTLHPNNVYVNEQGDVKLVHRGIRHVLPPVEFNEKQLLEEMKEIINYLFVGFSRYLIENPTLNKETESFISTINNSKSIKELLDNIEDSEQVKRDDTSEDSKSNLGLNKWKSPVVGNRKVKLSLLSGTLIGFLFGLLFLYITQVAPLNEATVATREEFQEEHKKLADENGALQQSLLQSEKVNQAYKLYIDGNLEEAISVLESDNIGSESRKEFLSQLYLESSNPEHLMKSVELSADNLDLVVEKLIKLNNEEANSKILTLQSDNPVLTIEQAWINQEFHEVIEIYEEIKERDRAKTLAARSFLELDMPEDAIELGEQLGDVSIQISGLEKQIELIEADKDLDEDEKKERIEELEERVEELVG